MEPPRLGAPGTPHSSTTTGVTHPDGTTVSTTTTCCAAPGVESEPPYVTEEWLALEYSRHAPKSVPIATRKLLREVVPGTQPVVCPPCNCRRTVGWVGGGLCVCTGGVVQHDDVSHSAQLVSQLT